MAAPNVHISQADLNAFKMRKLRRRAGLTVEQLARAIDMEESYIVSLESGDYPITRPAALAIRYVLEKAGLSS